MHVHVTDPAFTRDLLNHLRRSDCVVVQVGRDSLEAYPRDPLGPEDARRELGRHLVEWQAERNGAAAYLLD